MFSICISYVVFTIFFSGLQILPNAVNGESFLVTLTILQYSKWYLNKSCLKCVIIYQRYIFTFKKIINIILKSFLFLFFPKNQGIEVEGIYLIIIYDITSSSFLMYYIHLVIDRAIVTLIDQVWFLLWPAPKLHRNHYLK